MRVKYKSETIVTLCIASIHIDTSKHLLTVELVLRHRVFYSNLASYVCQTSHSLLGNVYLTASLIFM